MTPPPLSVKELPHIPPPGLLIVPFVVDLVFDCSRRVSFTLVVTCYRSPPFGLGPPPSCFFLDQVSKLASLRATVPIGEVFSVPSFFLVSPPQPLVCQTPPYQFSKIGRPHLVEEAFLIFFLPLLSKVGFFFLCSTIFFFSPPTILSPRLLPFHLFVGPPAPLLFILPFLFPLHFDPPPNSWFFLAFGFAISFSWFPSVGTLGVFFHCLWIRRFSARVPFHPPPSYNSPPPHFSQGSAFFGCTSFSAKPPNHPPAPVFRSFPFPTFLFLVSVVLVTSFLHDCFDNFFWKMRSFHASCTGSFPEFNCIAFVHPVRLPSRFV